MACSGVIPPCTNIHSSQCAPSPSRWPWAPSWTETPASLSFFASAALLRWFHSSSGAGVAVDDHGHVVLEERAALGDDHHAGLARGFDDLLALIAAGLVVALHTDGADRFHAPEVEERVVEIGNVGFEGSLGAVEDRA